MTELTARDLLPALDRTGLFSALRTSCEESWQHYTQHSFVQRLAAGSLPEACFRHYLVQDYLFLIQFARAYALAAYKSDNLDDMRKATGTLDALINTEMALHIRYCTGWGLDEASMAATAEEQATIAYTRYVLDVGQSGDLLDLLVALAPCAIGYAVIGCELILSPDTCMEGNIYQEWIETYSGPDYLPVALSAAEHLEILANRLCGDPAGGARFERLAAIFATATRLESAFWDMGLKPEN